MDRYFGCYKWATGLRSKIIKETGLPISAALSINKLVSKVGTGEAKPNGSREIPQGTEKGFLAPLSVAKIPGVGKETYKKLSFMGVREIKTLSEVPVKLLQREFGALGRGLWEKANAIDSSPVVPFHEQKSMSKERTFREDTLDIAYIKNLLTEMTDQLAYELRASQKLTACVAVKVRYADFNTFVKQKRISYTANDNELLKHVLQLFDTVYERRQLIRLVGIKFTDLVHGQYQIDLFQDTVEQVSLMKQLDHIRNRFGVEAIRRASGL